MHTFIHVCVVMCVCVGGVVREIQSVCVCMPVCCTWYTWKFPPQPRAILTDKAQTPHTHANTRTHTHTHSVMNVA